MYIPHVGLGQAGGIQTIAATIQQVEGYYPGTLAYKNNNPGNLIYVGQPGATPGAGGFAAFPSYDAGYQALLNQIESYATQGLTIQQMMNKYAPATDANGNPIPGNNPTLYASNIATALGVSTDASLSDIIGGDTAIADSGAGVVEDDSTGAIDPVLVVGGTLLVALVLSQLA